VNNKHQEIIIRANDKEFFPLVSNFILRFLLYMLVWLLGIGVAVGPAWAAVSFFTSK